MSGTAALHVLCNQASKLCLKKLGHEPSGGQIVKSQEVQAMGIISVDQIVLRHLFCANFIIKFIIRDN